MALTRERGIDPRPLGVTARGAPLPRVAARLGLLAGAGSRWAGWLWPLLVTALALGFRLWHLGQPDTITFDETYYAKDAWSLSMFGYVHEPVHAADDRINAGHIDAHIFTDGPAQIVHPEVGKWMIAVGIRLFGMDPFGWRVAAAVTGALTVLVLCRLVRRLSGSTLVGCLAGLLLCFDGLHLVMSRTALIDVFLAFWLVCAVTCMVADRDWGRRRMLRLVERDGLEPGGWGPVRAMLWRPWRVGAGVCFGLACGSKWNGVFVLAAFGLLAWAWDAGARRALGVSWAWARSAVVDAAPAVVSLVGVALVVYVGSWTGWLVHHDVMEQAYADYYHWGSYAQQEPDSWLGESEQAVRDLWNYHGQMWHFHTVDVVATTSKDPHPFESNPRGWLLDNRPVGFAMEADIPSGEQGCAVPTGQTCLKQVLALGNPAVWWLGAAALLASTWWWVARRDWRFGVPLVAVLAGWLPWFRWDDRSIFFFYAVAIVPFTCAALALVLGLLLGRADAPAWRRGWGAAAVGAVLVAVLVCFAFFWPIWTDQLITNTEWHHRMWFDRWI